VTPALPNPTLLRIADQVLTVRLEAEKVVKALPPLDIGGPE